MSEARDDDLAVPVILCHKGSATGQLSAVTASRTGPAERDNQDMPVADGTALIAALSSHRSHELLGTPESSWLDFKLSPWHLDNDRGKWELAKDVAAMAKGGGGLLVVGVETTRQAHDTHDTATGLSPFDRTIVNIDAVKGVLRAGSSRHNDLRCIGSSPRPPPASSSSFSTWQLSLNGKTMQSSQEHH